MPPFIQNMDFYISQALRSAQNPLLDFCASVLTDITYGGILWWILAIVLWKKKQKLLALEIMLALVFSIIEISVLKHLFHRERPTILTLHQMFKPLQTLTADRYSFPSGHTLSAFAAAGVVRIRYPDAKGNLALLIALSIGIARIYEGMHWPTDVIAGIVLGLFTAWMSIPLASKVYAKLENVSKT
ncbi:MAG: phosphatase PAP2 family protein [Candidatus Obscuribacterales bacterium]|nr:phosphatase PAP2 family protein [Candidatus Obscuribacterales bacterium]